jgi:hypothetical protein
VAFIDQNYSGEGPATEEATRPIRLEVVKVPGAIRGYLLLPRRSMIERGFAWTGRFRRLARAYERLQTTLEGRHCVAFLAHAQRRPFFAVL